ncbi:Wzz/FepE/Etk N-terminal domain-containing protein [Roseateles depolymerans]|uniref:Lipopolysaccharide biosynthesis protein n=1 Tax=Roseateles depolymerans TaxID=76731 RepID=A0A0U3MZQ7_9BURK|nr:Wzz/FepE/Etk N-terminal domain-containing protein [Roseateles depolymerans]ALV08483.1 Lipopolysaccharide biosynthesis protein [Roseateles depolymerans]REG21291.1 capsule polysaccharide export protein KpsE/RkpR [Roseateles depolymerans]
MSAAPSHVPSSDSSSLAAPSFQVGATLLSHWRLLIAGPIAAGALALGATYLMDPIYTAKTTFLPPQQQQGAAAAALQSLGALASLAGGSGAVKTPGDQYVAFMQSVTVEDRIVEKFKLMEPAKAKYRFEARNFLRKSARIELGKKDGLISVEVDSKDPQLAADIANQYVEELRHMTANLSLTEAQQRRAFFEEQLKNSKEQLARAQQELQTVGFNPGALKTEPRAAADNYARVKAELTAAEVRLQSLRRSLTDTAPEVQQQSAIIGALRSELNRLEASSSTNASDYIGKYREFKYQESLFELFSKQYELARLDESREGFLIQVIDPAIKPEYKSKPKRAQIALVTAFATGLALCAFLILRQSRRFKPGAAAGA